MIKAYEYLGNRKGLSLYEVAGRTVGVSKVDNGHWCEVLYKVFKRKSESQVDRDGSINSSPDEGEREVLSRILDDYFCHTKIA